MRRTIWLSVAASSLVSILLTALVITLALPGLVDAQATRIRAEQLTLVGDNGADRVQLQPGPGVGAYMRVLDTDGRVRIGIGTGGPAALGGMRPDASAVSVLDSNQTLRASIGVGGALQTQPESVSFAWWDSAGTQAGALGLGRGPQGDRPLSNILVLNDEEGRGRVLLRVADDGTPSIQMMDANGNVTWSAR
jgi:hypothetical protein